MPFTMKIQPLDTDSENLREPVRNDSAKPIFKSRLRRLFDKQFRISSAEKPTTAVVDPPPQFNKDGRETEFEPSSVCLAKMVQNFMEETNERQTPAAKCGRNRCNCFNTNSNDKSDDEFDMFGGFSDNNSSGSFGGDTFDMLKNLIPCVSVNERNLLADTAKIVEKNKTNKHKDDLRKIVTEGLLSLGYDSSICKSKWDKSPSNPAGEYEYIDVIVDGERLLIDIDFRSEFEIARSTGTYNSILQFLPYNFVGKSDRLGQILTIVSEAAKQSLKKKGMHIPPWRKAEYMRAKWFSSYTRTTQPHKNDSVSVPQPEPTLEDSDQSSDCGELELIFGEETTPSEQESNGDAISSSSLIYSGELEKKSKVIPAWKPPVIKPKSVDRGTKIVTGLACLLKEKSQEQKILIPPP